MTSYFFFGFQVHHHSAELGLETLHVVVSYVSFCTYGAESIYYLVAWSLVWEFLQF